MRIERTSWLALSALCGALLMGRAEAQTKTPDTDNSRAVRIMGEDAGPAKPVPVVPPAVTMDTASLKADNTAGLSINLLPGTDLAIGDKVTFRITTRKAGYLILVDVDASGRLRQVYPSPSSLLAPGAASELSNRMKSNETVSVPDPKNPFAGFEYVVAPPTGVAMIVAILGDRPVQVLDLPDVPTTLTGHAEALKYLADLARTLRVAQNGGDRGFAQPTWSFDAKFYVVK